MGLRHAAINCGSRYIYSELGWTDIQFDLWWTIVGAGRNAHDSRESSDT